MVVRAPVPLKFAVCGLSVPLSVMVTVPVRLPVNVGLKVTLIRHADATLSEVPQLFVWAKSPLVAMLEMVKVDPVELAKVREITPLVVPTT